MATSARYDACIQAIQKAAGELLGEDDVEALVETVQRRYRARRRANPLEDERLALAEIAKGIADEERLAALVEKRSRAINVLRKTQRLDFYARYEGREAEGVSTLNVGSQKAEAGAGRSVAAQQKGLRADLLGPLVAELRAANLLELIGARAPELERDIVRNMWELTTADVEKRTAALTGSEQSQAAARILVKYQEAARQMQNDAGAWIGKTAGYVVKQSHDMLRIRKAGATPDQAYQAWRAVIEPRLDPKTYDLVGIDAADPRQVDEFLRTVWTELAGGEHYRTRDADTFLGGFKGPGNLAKKVSQHRVLQFKSADDWLAYNERFGLGGLMEAVVHGLNRAADTTALLKTWGTNPEAAFEADLQQLRERAAKRADAKTVDGLKGGRLQREFDQLTGAANVPANPTWAQVGAFTRGLINMSSLGGVVLSSIPDNAIKAAVLRHHGIGFLQGHADALADLVRGRAAGEQRAIADDLAAGIDGVLGSIAARYVAEDTLPGKTARMQNWFFKMNLLSWWTDAKTTGAGLIMARNLARNLGTAFDGLDPLLQTTLRRYGLGPDQWAALQKVETRLAGETAYLMPDAVDRLPDEILWPLAKDRTAKSIQRAKDELRLGLRTFYAEELAAVQTLGGARERAIATWGTQPGTGLGETVRFLMQFKMYPITFATRHLAREWQRGGAPGMVHMILATTALGYLSQSAKEIAKGREPRPLDDPKTWLAAAQQGGGLGIYGDFLFGEFNRFGGGALETLAGPAVGKVSEILRAFSDAKEGEPADAIAKLVKAGVNSIPGINLFYTRAALDYLILYQMQEWANPGYLRRLERRLERENGQRFILPPSQQIPHGGGSTIFAGVGL